MKLAFINISLLLWAMNPDFMIFIEQKYLFKGDFDTHIVIANMTQGK